MSAVSGWKISSAILAHKSRNETTRRVRNDTRPNLKEPTPNDRIAAVRIQLAVDYPSSRQTFPPHPKLPKNMIQSLIRFVSLMAVLAASAAEPPSTPPIPSQSIAKKKELLFTDDFEGVERDKRWHRVVDTFAFENGALKGTQTRVKDMPSKDGKSIIKAHAAVYGLEVPTRDSVIEVKMRFDGATMMDVEFDDRQYTGSHYGHLCRAQVRLDRVTIMDEREGSQNEEIKKMKEDPAKKEEVARRMAGKSASFPIKLDPDKTHTVLVETVGEEMRVTIDGKPAGYLRSPGIGHATKSKIELGVAGQSGWFDEIRVWNAEAAAR